MNFCRAPVCLKASPTSVKIHSVVRTWRLPIGCNSSGMPSITSAPVSDEMNRVPEDLHRRGGPMKIMIVILRVIPVAEPPRSRLPPAALRPTIFRRRQYLFFQQLVQFQIYLGELIPFQPLLMISCVLICSLLSNRLQLAARVLRINSLPLAVKQLSADRRQNAGI